MAKAKKIQDDASSTGEKSIHMVAMVGIITVVVGLVAIVAIVFGHHLEIETPPLDLKIKPAIRATK